MGLKIVCRLTLDPQVNFFPKEAKGTKQQWHIVSAIWAGTTTVFLHSFSLVNKYVTLIEPIRNAAHVCHPRINKQSALFRGWFIATRECPLPADWSVHWLNRPSLLSCSQQQRRLCFCYRTHKFLKPSFNLRSLRFSEFHACTGPTDRRTDG